LFVEYGGSWSEGAGELCERDPGRRGTPGSGVD
jgi:hypothetical protein